MQSEEEASMQSEEEASMQSEEEASMQSEEEASMQSEEVDSTQHASWQHTQSVSKETYKRALQELVTLLFMQSTLHAQCMRPSGFLAHSCTGHTACMLFIAPLQSEKIRW
jgi:hypothetical protein